jgi:hypothetical protein
LQIAYGEEHSHNFQEEMRQFTLAKNRELNNFLNEERRALEDR